MKYHQQITHSKIFDFNKKKNVYMGGMGTEENANKNIVGIFLFSIDTEILFVQFNYWEYATVRYETSIQW